MKLSNIILHTGDIIKNITLVMLFGGKALFVFSKSNTLFFHHFEILRKK
jgi:hypothetical protein